MSEQTVKRTRRIWDSEEIRILREEHTNLTLAAIARILNRNPGSVYAKMMQLGLPPKPSDRSAKQKAAEQEEARRQAEDECVNGWKGKLGWSFTAEECSYERRMRLEAAAWFHKKYGTGRKARDMEGEEIPLEMTRAEAERWLNVNPLALAYGIRNGLLPYHKKEGRREMFLYSRHILDYMTEMKKAGKWAEWRL